MPVAGGKSGGSSNACLDSPVVFSVATNFSWHCVGIVNKHGNSKWGLGAQHKLVFSFSVFPGAAYMK